MSHFGEWFRKPSAVFIVFLSAVILGQCNLSLAYPILENTTTLVLTPAALTQLQGADTSSPAPFVPKTPAPAMVPVSSTVIPVTNVKAPSARQSSSNYYYSRRFRFFDKSSKPDTPIRLITKNSNLKKVYDVPKSS